MRLGFGIATIFMVFGVACTTRAPSGEDKKTTPAAEDKKPAPPAEVKAGTRSWPMFGGNVRRNLANNVETGIADTWSVKKGKPQKNVKWSVKLGGKSLGGPVVVDGRIFVCTNRSHHPKDREEKGVLLCFRETDGKFLWQAVHDKLEGDDAGGQGCGIASTPCVEGNRLWYVNNRWEVVCADVAGDEATGKAKILWTLDMIKDLKVYPGGLAGSLSICSPLLVGDLLYVVTANGVDSKGKTPAPDAPSFVALNKNTGKVVWKDSSPGKNIMDGQWSNPVAAEVNGAWQVVFPGGDGWLYSFEAKTGKLLWKFDCNPKKADFKPGGRGTRGFPVATPVIWDNKLYVGIGRQPDDGNGEGHLWCIDIVKASMKDKDPLPVNDNSDPKVVANKDSGLVWHFGGSIEPAPEDGGREYVFGRTLSTVSIHDGLVYAAELTGYLNCLDAKTGKKYWEADLKGDTWSSPFYVDGKVYLGANNGNMFVYRHGKEMKKLATIDMSESLQTPPVAVNGVLYVANGYNLYAIAPDKR
jgi:outer membrane protein assembly factor BamB